MSEYIEKSNREFIAFVKRHATAARFIFIGSINTVIDLLLFAVSANIFNIFPVAASILSTGITLIFSFFMNHYFVFKSGKRKRNTAIQFILMTLFNVWVVQSSVIFVALHVFGDIEFFKDHTWTFNMFAKMCGISVSLVLNYLSYRTIFRGDKTHGQ